MITDLLLQKYANFTLQFKDTGEHLSKWLIVKLSCCVVRDHILAQSRTNLAFDRLWFDVNDFAVDQWCVVKLMRSGEALTLLDRIYETKLRSLYFTFCSFKSFYLCLNQLHRDTSANAGRLIWTQHFIVNED